MKTQKTQNLIYNNLKGFNLVLVLFFLLQFNLSPISFGQDGQFVLSNGLGGTTFTIGGTSSNWQPSPFIAGRKDYRVQFLYEAAELPTTYRKITSLAFKLVGYSSTFNLPNFEMKNITIKMGHTIATYDGYLGTEVWGVKMPPEGQCTWDGVTATPEFLEVVKAPFDITLSQNIIIENDGWIEIQLDEPFEWDGNRSVVVEICKNDTSVVSGSAYYKFEGSTRHSVGLPPSSNPYALSRSLYSNSNGGSVHTPGCEMQISGPATMYNTSNPISASLRKARPNIRFTFECAGGPKAGDAVILTEDYCTGEDVELHVQDDEKSSGLFYQWFYSYADDDNFVILPSATGKTLTVERAEVDMWYVRHVTCSADLIEGSRISGAVRVKGINTWDGTFWSFGTEPGENEPVRINGNFDTSIHGTDVLEACTLYVESGTFTVKEGDVLSITDKLKVHEDATLLFENNSSLIQKNDSAVNEGKIIYKRNSQPVRLLDYTYWSSPVAGMTPSAFSPGTPTNRIYHWNHLTTGPNPQIWVGGVANTAMFAGKGYIIRAPNGYPSSGTGNVFEGVFEGVPNNGIINVPAQGGTGHFNLIGNPYPAAIDANEFLIANSAILDGTIQLWTHNTLPSTGVTNLPDNFPTHALNYSSDDYATYNLSGSIGLPAENSGNNNSTPGRFIGAGQSFMVEGVSSASVGNVIFNNEMRERKTGYNNTQFFRTSSESETLAEEKHRVWLELIHQNGKFKQTMVGYVDGATDGVDWGYDSKLKPSGDIMIYSLINDQKFVIQGKALPFNQQDSFPLGLTTVLSGEFLLNLYQFDALFENQNVYLLDNYTNTFHNLKDGAYVFASEVGTFDDRFELRFTDEVLSLNPVLNTKNDIICFTNEAMITIKSNETQMVSVKVFDGAGRLLFDKNKFNTTEIVISELNKSNQLMIVEVITENGSKSIHKILF